MERESDVCAICHEEPAGSLVRCGGGHAIHRACFVTLVAYGKRECVLGCKQKYVDPVEQHLGLLRLAIRLENWKYARLLFAEEGVLESYFLAPEVARKKYWAAAEHLLELEAEARARGEALLPAAAGEMLLRAAIEAPLETTGRLLDAGLDPNWVSRFDRTALDEALERKRMDVAQLLVDRGADVNLCTDKYSPPIFRAIALQNNKAVEFLLRRGADVNAWERNRSETPLHRAVERLCKKTVQLLLDLGRGSGDVLADVNAFGKFGTPIMYALCDSLPASKAIAALLLEHGARLDLVDAEGNSLLHHAGAFDNFLYRGGHQMEFLLKHGARPHLELQNAKGHTPLAVALEAGRDKPENHAAAALVRAGAVLAGWRPGSRGFENLCRHARHALEQEDAAYVAKLLDVGVPVDTQTTGFEKQLEPLVWTAVKHERLDTLRLLLDRGVDPLTPGPSGQESTALTHLAARRRDGKLMELLLERGAPRDSLNDAGHAPLHVAVLLGNTEPAKALLKAGASYKQPTAAGNAPLDLAASKLAVGHPITKLLQAHQQLAELYG